LIGFLGADAVGDGVEAGVLVERCSSSSAAA
jgi:hypothetical protein